MSMHGDGGPGTKYFPAARSCDYCESEAALLFCRSDSAFLCIACDSKLHVSHTKHERVWMCEVCEQAAAVVVCKADAAVLCSDCDSDIHSANPLACRHDRTPVVPFYENAESVVLKSSAAPFVPIYNLNSSSGVEQADLLTNASSWMPTKLPAEGPDVKSIEFLLSDSDQLLDFEISQQISSHLLGDCVVPVQTTTKPPVPSLSPQNYSSDKRLEIDFTTSNVNSYHSSYTTSSLSHSVSSSSIDLGVVPDGSALSDISYPFPSNVMNSVVDLSGHQGFPAIGLDREARVLRYREKRKNRRFQKTIRYASRKAYAETRPRVKGRFAKRTDGELELEGEPVFISGSPDYVFDARYDVVMSF
ncbi:zinc finger protein CONSTANS-LIKE 5-like [Primulina eburnea]|uniref:zinc finger protein CONSTANS-LIKE 5-like n=1 Tax=Primulina eburnea TaxID=1245227 RepID=UPI003C6C2CD8